VKQPVPQLGDESVSFEDVNNFYSFWYGTVFLQSEFVFLTCNMHQS